MIVVVKIAIGVVFFAILFFWFELFKLLVVIFAKYKRYFPGRFAILFACVFFERNILQSDNSIFKS